MLSTLAVTALLGLSVSAAPAPPSYGPPSGYNHGGSSSSSGPQVPFKFPLPNGFPNIAPNSSALNAIQQQAHGTLPNGPPNGPIQDATATTFQLIAFNELFEVAFFTSLLNNITSGAFDVGSPAVKNIVVNAITAVQAQEELHALGANGILSAAGRTQIQPCEYVFPSADFDSAISTASLFTDVVLGTLQDALNTFGTDGDTGFLALIGSIIGQEGEQNGFYRSSLGKIPSALPFLTRSAGPFAFSALNQVFVVPGTCGNLDAIDLPIFGALNVLTPPSKPEDQTVRFSFKTNGTSNGADVKGAQEYQGTGSLSLVYINQQNVPVVEELKNIQTEGDVVTFEADFPGATNLMNGLTIAAVTSSKGPFASADDVAAATLFGPGLIEIN